MNEPVKSSDTPGSGYRLKPAFKYPSEDECLVRRLGSAVLASWATLPPDVQERILAEAAIAWDREYGVAQLPQKLASFVKRHPARVV
jgi:hypothetical protein